MKALLLLCLLPASLAAQVFGIQPLAPLTELQGFLRAPVKGGGWEVNPPVANPLFVYYTVEVDNNGRVSGVMAFSDHYSPNAEGQAKMRLALKSLLLVLVEKYGDRFGASAEGKRIAEPTIEALLPADSFDALWSRTYHSRTPDEIDHIIVGLVPAAGKGSRAFMITYRFKGFTSTGPDVARGL